MQGNIAVIGDSGSIIGFKALGFKTVCVTGKREVEEAVDSLVKDNCFVILITEHALTGAESVLNKYKDDKIPAIIPIPGRFGNTGIGRRNLDNYVERALGSDILGTQEDE